MGLQVGGERLGLTDGLVVWAEGGLEWERRGEGGEVGSYSSAAGTSMTASAAHSHGTCPHRQRKSSSSSSSSSDT